MKMNKNPIYIHLYIYQLCWYLASCDFFQEKQPYLLTESPLSKYEEGRGGQPPYTLLYFPIHSLDHILKGHFHKIRKNYFMWVLHDFYNVELTLKGHGNETDISIFFA